MHFPNPPPLMPTAQILMGEKTHKGTAETNGALAEGLGKKSGQGFYDWSQGRSSISMEKGFMFIKITGEILLWILDLLKSKGFSGPMRGGL